MKGTMEGSNNSHSKTPGTKRTGWRDTEIAFPMQEACMVVRIRMHGTNLQFNTSKRDSSIA